MTELMTKALSEGIDTAHPGNSSDSATTDVKPAAESSTPAPEATKTQAQEPAKSPETLKAEEQVPFHKHPRFQELIRENKDIKRRYEEMEKRLTTLSQPQPVQPQSTLTDEQRYAAIELAKILKEVPEVSKLLGLDQLQSIQASNQQIMTERLEGAFNKELDEVTSYAVTLGMTKDEVESEIIEAMQSNPLYSTLNYSPGIVKAAFRDLFWDKLGELKEREINSKLIKEQGEKKRANAETSSPESQKGKAPTDSSVEQFIQRRIREEGGIVV